MSHREGVSEVPQGDLHVHAMLAEPAWIPHQHTHIAPVLEQQGEQLAPDHPRGSRQQYHAATVATRSHQPAEGHSRLNCRSRGALRGAASAIKTGKEPGQVAY